MKLLIEVELEKGDGKGTAEEDLVASALCEEIETLTLWVESTREDGEEREYIVKTSRRLSYDGTPL